MAIEEVEKAAERDGAVGTAETAAAPASDRRSYPVAPGHRVNVRSGPSTGTRLVKVLPYGAHVVISCQRPGQRVIGPYGVSAIWDKIGPGQYVADAYVNTGHDGYVAPRCS